MRLTEQDFIAELASGLRVGPLTKRRILREVSEHLKDRALARDGRALSGDELGEPSALAAEFTATYASHRWARMERGAGATVPGGVATLIACAAFLGLDADGDRLAVELPLVVAVAAALSLAVLSRGGTLLAIPSEAALVVPSPRPLKTLLEPQ